MGKQWPDDEASIGEQPIDRSTKAVASLDVESSISLNFFSVDDSRLEYSATSMVGEMSVNPALLKTGSGGLPLSYSSSATRLLRTTTHLRPVHRFDQIRIPLRPLILRLRFSRFSPSNPFDQPQPTEPPLPSTATTPHSHLPNLSSRAEYIKHSMMEGRWPICGSLLARPGRKVTMSAKIRGRSTEPKLMLRSHVISTPD
jgi:hypothetical protein